MAEEQTKEALMLTIRELGRQNEALQRKLASIAHRPKSEGVVSACLGFGIIQIPANRQIEIMRAHPQVIFRPTRLCVARECAKHFMIDEIRVGMNSQFIAPGSIPASLFAVENVHRLRETESEEDFDAPIPMEFDTACPGMFVLLQVSRIDNNSIVPFECVMVGETVGLEKDELLPKGPVSLPKKEIREN